MTLDALFSVVWEMSLTGAIVIVVVGLARLCLKRLPKSFAYALWAIVLFRLLCPISLPAPVSLFSIVKPLELPGATNVEGVVVDGGLFNSVPADQLQPIDPSLLQGTDTFHTYPLIKPVPIKETETFPFETVWLVGVAIGAVCGGISSLRLRRRLIGSVEVGGRIRLADHIDTPFVFGIFRPKIYLPSNVDWEKQPHILRHEQYHIRRGDHVWRFLAYVALCIHWFNPLVWAAFWLSGKDMEMSCDEAVIRRMGSTVRADYSAALLAAAAPRKPFAVLPIGFGEISTKSRVKNLLHWKKTALWVSVAAIVCCSVLAAVCLLDPAGSDESSPTALFGYGYDVTDILYSNGLFSFAYHDLAVTPDYRIDHDGVLWINEHQIRDRTDETWQAVGQLSETELTAETFSNGFGPIQWFENTLSPESVLADNRRAWVVDLPGDGLSYYLLEQTDGRLYLACWYDIVGYPTAETTAESRVLVRWLFEIEQMRALDRNLSASDKAVRYTTETEIYRDPYYALPSYTLTPVISFTQPNTAVWQYHQTPSGRLFYRYIRRDGTDLGWVGAGMIQETSLAEDVWRNGFSKIRQTPVADLLADTKKLYQVVNGEQWTETGYHNGLNFYLLEQNNGEYYLAEWIDVSDYTPEIQNDTVKILSVRSLRAEQSEETVYATATAYDYALYQTTARAIVERDGGTAVLANGSELWPSENLPNFVPENAQTGSEILLTYLGGNADGVKHVQVICAEVTNAPCEIVKIPERITVTVSGQRRALWVVECAPENTSLPISAEQPLYCDIAQLQYDETALVSAMIPATVTLTTDGTAYRYDRADGTVEYWISPTRAE